jgi:hypothetical protein
MSVEVSRKTSPTAADAAVGRPTRWYLVPLLVFAASRIVDTVFIALASRRQVALTLTRQDYHVFDPTPAAPGYAGVVANWDGQWYWRIATLGYEVPAPGSAGERDALWAWAFPPGYPAIVRGLMSVTGLSFTWAATVVSVLAGAAAMVLMYRLVRRHAGHFLATVTVVLSSFFVSAPLLQVAYSESLAMLLLMATLNLLADRRYWWAALCVVLLAFTRIVTLPLLLVVLAHAWARWRTDGPFWRADRRGALGLALVAGASAVGTVLWMLVASLFIGWEAGTKRSLNQRGTFQGWFRDLHQLFGLPGMLLLVAFVVLLGLNLFTSRGRVWGPELRAWSLAYPLYLFWFTPLLPAVFRYLLLVPTLPVLLLGTPRRPTKIAIIVVAVAVACLLVGQYWYAGNILVVFTEDLRPGP